MIAVQSRLWPLHRIWLAQIA